jgi:hypothetical protein
MKKYWVKLSVRASVFVVVSVFSSLIYAQEIVLAFEGALGRSASLDGTARTKMLIRNMARADVKQAMFLIEAKKVTQDTIDRLEFYDETGQLLVNAGYNYSLLHRSKNYGYPIDIMKADGVLEPYTNYHKHIYYPYLYGGGDAQLLEQLENFLAEHNYSPTYVTTRVHDEYMDHLYQLRIQSGRTVDIRQLEKAYVKMIVKEVKAYDAKAHMLLGFSPRQVLLLHENDLAAYCIVGLIDSLNAGGFRVIAPEKVFTDPISNPYFVSGYAAESYMPYITGIAEESPRWLPVANQSEREQINGYLREQGLESLISP